MLQAIDRLASHLSRSSVVLTALAAVALLGVADRLSGFELSFSLFYFAPIAFGSWYAGGKAGSLIAMASACAWLAADLSAGHVYSSVAALVWNAVMRLSIFAIFARLLATLHDGLAAARQLAQTDPLTGVDNRRAFLERLRHGLALAARERRPLTLAYLDVDDFKGINDAHGHAVGDHVLRILARTLSQALRRTDAVGRLGGDEFGLLLPDTDLPGAEMIIAKTRDALYHAFRTERARPTCSVGAVTFADRWPDVERAVSAADALMYQVKSRGKDGTAFGREPCA